MTVVESETFGIEIIFNDSHFFIFWQLIQNKPAAQEHSTCAAGSIYSML